MFAELGHPRLTPLPADIQMFDASLTQIKYRSDSLSRFPGKKPLSWKSEPRGFLGFVDPVQQFPLWVNGHRGNVSECPLYPKSGHRLRFLTCSIWRRSLSDSSSIEHRCALPELSAVSRQRSMERFAGANISRHRVEDGSNPRGFGIYFSVCRIELGTSARQLGLTPNALGLQ